MAIAPRDAGLNDLFPSQVENFRLVSKDKKAVLTDFEFTAPGDHAIYKSPEATVEVFVYQVPQLEKAALCRRLEAVYDRDEGGSKHLIQLSYRCYYASGSPNNQYHAWWIKGWLIVVSSSDQEDQEPFVLSYLKALSQPINQVVGN